jgi:hypothetical protein
MECQSWNEGVERLFGYWRTRRLAAHHALLPTDRRDEEKEILAESARRRQTISDRSVRKDRALLDVSLTISPLKDLNSM